MTHRPPTSRRGRQIVTGLAAAVALGALVGGVPWALTRFIGWPLPHRVPTWAQTRTTLSTQGIPDRVLLDTLAVIVWLAWATLITALTAELPTTLRRTPTRVPRVARPAHHLAAPLLAAITIGVLALGRPNPTVTVPLSTALGHTSPGTAPIALVLTGDEAKTRSAPAALSVVDHASALTEAVAATRTYVVQRRDTLWGIAQRELGDPYRWRELFDLNHNRPQPAHGTLTDPNNLQPGWTLALPVAAAQEPTSAAPAPAPAQNSTPSAGTVTVPPPAVASLPVVPVIPSTPFRQPARNLTAGDHTSAGRTTAGAITLSTGSLVAGSFALGLATALTTQRLRRRHTYQPHPPTAGLPASAPPPSPTLRTILNALTPTDLAPPEPTPSPREPELSAAGTPGLDLVELGVNDRGPVAAALGELSPLTLTGTEPGAALRAWISHLLTTHRPGDLQIRADIGGTWILGLADTLAPPLATTTSSTDLLDALHAEVIHRTRRLDDAGITDADTYRTTHREDPLPVLLAVTAALSPQNRTRWTRLTADAGRLGILAIHFGLPDDNGDERTITTDDTHTITAAHPKALADRLNGVHCYHLTAAEARDLLATVTAAQGTDADPTAVIDLRDEPASITPAEPATEPWVPPVSTTPAEQKPIRVQLLGPPTISVNGTPITSGLRRSAIELLAWYLLHPNGSPAAAAIDAIWPDAPTDRGPQRFWTALGNLRTRIRALSEGESLDILTKQGDLYRPDANVLTVDLWDFQEALHTSTSARTSGDLEGEREALEQAVQAYGGVFADGSDYFWADAIREDLHRRALDAHLALVARLAASDNSPRAIELLTAAVELDRYAEEPYRLLMIAQSKRGDNAAVTRTWRLLQGRLAEIDLEVDPVTVKLCRTLSRGQGDLDHSIEPGLGRMSREDGSESLVPTRR